MSATRLADEPEQAVRDFMYALYANDAADFQKRILPEANSTALIGPQTFTQAQLEKLRNDINGLALRQTSPPSLDGRPLPNSSAPFPVGTKTVYFTQFRGVLLAIPMQRSEDGWKADVRFWLAMRKQREVRPQRTDPEMVAKGFLFHILAKKPEALNEFMSPGGLMGSVEVPFLVRRVDGAWKVVPQRYFEMLRKVGAV